MFRLGLTPPHPCDYLPGREARSLVVVDEASLSPSAYDFFLAQGFRRSGSHVYRPWCDRCRQCVAVRIPVEAFRPDRGQRRVLRRNGDLEAEWVVTDRLDDEQWRLYRSYLQARHADGEMVHASRAASDDFLFGSWPRTRLLELRLGAELVAVAVTDQQPRSLSALYTFFHPAHARRSLGTLAILLQVEAARREGRPWLYLGYWIPDCRKMSYKAGFLPLEARRAERKIGEEQWARLENAVEAARFRQRVQAPFHRPDAHPFQK